MSNLLYELGDFSGESIFIDGTKSKLGEIKYTFVWKKAVTKNQEKLLIKIAVVLQNANSFTVFRLFTVILLK